VRWIKSPGRSDNSRFKEKYVLPFLVLKEKVLFVDDSNARLGDVLENQINSTTIPIKESSNIYFSRCLIFT
jgi:hypothetical protein